MADQYRPTVVELETRVDQQQAQQVEILQQALDRARRGEFRALALVALDQAGAANSAVAASDCAAGLVGALAFAQHRVMNDSFDGGR